MANPVTPRTPKRDTLKLLVAMNPEIRVPALMEALNLSDTRIRTLAREEGISLAGSRSKRAAFIEAEK